LILNPIGSFAVKFCSETACVANIAGAWKISKAITFSGGADWVTM
jgi:hypothetical protein